MKKIINSNFILALMALSLLATACGPQNPGVSSPQTWIDAPLPGSTIPLAPYQIIAHAAFPTGISQFELNITGLGTEMVSAPAGQSLVYINHTWTPPSPGTYLIQVRAAGPEGTYGQAVEVQVQVGDVIEPAEEVPPPDSEACVWTAAINVFVRQGPGASVYPEITAVEAGKMLPVIGQSQDQQFWAVQLSNGQAGYVPKAERFGQVSGDCNVPSLPDPAPPKPTAPPAPPEPTNTPRLPQCSDGIDNDNDGRVDYGALRISDLECTSPDDDDESSR